MGDGQKLELVHETGEKGAVREDRGTKVRRNAENQRVQQAGERGEWIKEAWGRVIKQKEIGRKMSSENLLGCNFKN